MADRQKSKKSGNNFIVSSVTKDLITIFVVFVLVLVLSYFFNIFLFIVRLFQKHPRAITYIDEIITGLVTLSVSFSIFSWRRWKELKEETSKRIEVDEELIRIADTNVEVERIINKQLRCEIELRSEKKVSSLRLKSNKRNE